MQACHEMWRDFTPLVYSVDGCAGRETKQAERKVAAGVLAAKWDHEYSEMVAYVRARMALAVVRANARFEETTVDEPNALILMKVLP